MAVQSISKQLRPSGDVANKPLDARTEVNSYNDLQNLTGAYAGMHVYVKNNYTDNQNVLHPKGEYVVTEINSYGDITNIVTAEEYLNITEVEANPEGEHPSAVKLLALKIGEQVYMVPEPPEPDAQLSGTSINSVQNKVVKQALDIKAPSSNIQKTALASDVQTSLDKANTAVQPAEMTSALASKQDTLVSGTSIKTVNNTSLLGSGNIQINDGVGFQTITTQQDGTMVITLTNGDTITVDLNHQHPNYYSKVVETTQPSGGMLPDVTYKLGTLTGATTFSFAAAVSGNLNHYYFVFTSGSTAVVPTWPASITSWDGNCVDSTTGLPVIAASKTYEVSVLDGNAIIKEW